MHGVWSKGFQGKRKTKEDLDRGVEKDYQARKFNQEDAINHSRCRKLIKDVWWTWWCLFTIKNSDTPLSAVTLCISEWSCIVHTHVYHCLSEHEKVRQKAVRWPCGVCSKVVGSNSLQHTSCQKWVHKKCSGINGSESKGMKSIGKVSLAYQNLNLRFFFKMESAHDTYYILRYTITSKFITFIIRQVC